MRSFACTRIAAALLGLSLALYGCDDGDGDDAGPGDTDAGPVGMDAGPPADDDAGPPSDGDAGPDTDAGPMDTDAGDAVVGGGAASSAQIQAVLDAVDGASTLMIDDAVVTYVKAGFGAGIDGPGFFVQAERMGPALYVNVDPTTLTPTPEVGQVVDLQVTMKATDSSTIEYADTIDMWNVDSSGNSVEFLVQDVSNVDIVTMLDDHVAELVRVTGATIESEFTEPAGTGFDAAQITTMAVTTASGDLRLRLPEAVRAGSDLGFACTVDVGPTPVWRFDTTAQISAWDTADFTVSGCPAPGPNDLQISEIGFLFTGADAGKQFVEVFNDSESFAFELMGCRLADSGGFAGPNAAEVTASMVIGPGEHVVFAGPMATSEVTGDVAIPAGLVFDASDSAQLGCNCAAGADCADTVDVVDWSGGSFPMEMDEVSVQLAPGATDNDDLSNWCATPMASTYGVMGRRGTPGAANAMCPCPAGTGLVINELDYDQPGTDNMEYVELYNPTGATISLAGLSLVFFEAAGASAGMVNNNPSPAEYALSGTLGAGQFLVVATAGVTVAGGATTVAMTPATNAMENGADAVAIIDTSRPAIIDFVSYEGALTTIDYMGTMLTVVENTSAGTDSGASSLSRIPDGCDFNDSARDWTLGTPTPGVANTP